MDKELDLESLDNVVGGAHKMAAEEIAKNNGNMFRRLLTQEELDKIWANLPKDEFGNPIIPQEPEPTDTKGRGSR